MRKNQVSIRIQRFGDAVPKELERTVQTINVYCDSNNLYEALTGAFYEAVSEIAKTDNLPSFGVREHYEDTSEGLARIKKLSDSKNTPE